MVTLIRLLIVAVVDFVFYTKFGYGSNPIKVGQLYIVPMFVLLFSLLGTIAPQWMKMGVTGYSKYLWRRVFPLVYVALILYAGTLLPQTRATAIFAAMLIGNSIAYIATAITEGKKK